MAAAAVATRDKIVGSAMELFWELGYEATGISDIVERAGVRSGSLYHFFENKEHVLVAVLEAYQSALVPHIFEPPFRPSWDTRPRHHFDATIVRVRTDSGLEALQVVSAFEHRDQTSIRVCPGDLQHDLG